MKMNVHPALFLWTLFSIPASGLSFILFYPDPISMFHLFYTMMNGCAFVYLWIGGLDTIQEDSTDWNDGGSVALWTIVGLGGLFAVTLFLSLIFRNVLPSIWVPHELYPLQIADVGTIFVFAMSLFGTWFSVAPGEEGLKVLTKALHHGFQHIGFDLPLALHPAALVSIGFWAVLHVAKAQQGYWFGVSVFASGMVMDSCAAQSGTMLTSYLIHALFNSVILFAALVTGGFITVVPS